MTRNRFVTTRFHVAGGTLVIDLEKRRKVLSSAPCYGGLSRTRYIVNHQVPANPVAAPAVAPRRGWTDPQRYLTQVAQERGAAGRTVGLMTAVPLTQLVTLREASGDLWVEGFLTVGVTNAVRAGEPVKPAKGGRPGKPGTINIIVVTNARLSDPAMVGAVQVITESKTSALLAADVPSWTGRRGATGTGTDAVVVVCGAGRTGPRLSYSGTHTKVGELIGRLVVRGVAHGLQKSDRWFRLQVAPRARKSC